MKRSLFQEKEEVCENCVCNCTDEEYCSCICECDEKDEIQNIERNKRNERDEQDENTQNKKIKNVIITLDDILKNDTFKNDKKIEEKIDYMDIDIDIEAIEKLKNKYMNKNNSQKKYEPLNNQIKFEKIIKILHELNKMLEKKQYLTKLDKLIVHEYTKEIKELINN